MALEKVNYVDGETPIEAKNLNDIQDAVIANQQAVEDKVSKCVTVTASGTNLNDYLDEGLYYFGTNYTPTNIPAGNNGWLHVMRRKTTSRIIVKQIWYRQGDRNVTDHLTYIRTYDSEIGWGDWTNFITKKDALQMTELWKNASPTSTFGEQTISLDLSGYDMVLVRARLHTTTSHFCPVVMVDIGGNKGLLCGNPHARIARRLVTAKAAGVTFEGAVYFANYGETTSTANNDYLIPVSIHGIKGVVA